MPVQSKHCHDNLPTFRVVAKSATGETPRFDCKDMWVCRKCNHTLPQSMFVLAETSSGNYHGFTCKDCLDKMSVPYMTKVAILKSWTGDIDLLPYEAEQRMLELGMRPKHLFYCKHCERFLASKRMAYGIRSICITCHQKRGKHG